MRTIEPTQITTREEVQWTREYADYSASLWQLNYYFRGPGVGFNAVWGTEITADGDKFVIVVPGSKTDDVDVAGNYVWQAWLTEIADATNKKLIGTGRTRITLGFDPSSTATLETRTQNRILLDAITAAISGLATANVMEYEISTPAGSRKIKKLAMADLIEAQKHYAGIVAREESAERARQTGKWGRSVKLRVYDNG